MKSKIIFIVIIVILIIIIGIYQAFFKKEKPVFALAEVSRGNVLQEVSATGQVQIGEEINLNFKNSGRIEKIYVEVGDEVLPGQKLIKLETNQLSIQLREAEANVEAQKARLLELQKGARTEEIQISQTLLNKANNDLDNLYKNTPTTLNQTYNLADYGIRQRIAVLFLYRAEVTIPYYELTYKNCDNQAASDATVQRKNIEDTLNTWRTELQNLDNKTQTLDDAISKAEKYLTDSQVFLNRLNDTLIANCPLTLEEINKINNYKSLVNLALTDINTALTSVYSQSKAIEAQKLIVQNYQAELNLKLEGPTPEQIAYQEALLKQAEANVALLENQIEESTLRSPTKGEITKIGKKIGEMVQPVLAESMVSLLPASPYQIKVDIYEEDIVKIDVGNPVNIVLSALPEKNLKGKVVSINPAEKLIGGVVYYEITIDLEDSLEAIKPGMTADVLIKTASKENVLVIPQAAIEKKDGKTSVQVLVEKNFEEREITIGLEGSDDMAEVLSGLREGEQVMIK